MSKSLNEDNAIPLEWIKDYTDRFLILVKDYSSRSSIGQVTLERVGHIYDLVEAYKNRNIPLDKRYKS